MNNNGIDIIVEVRDSLPPLNIDKNVLHQILTNLLTNSLKYTVAGSILILAEYEHTSIKIIIEDTGIGMDSEKEVPYIFDCCWRSQKVQHNIAGHGLGMTVVKKLVGDLEGKIEVFSQVNVGTVVTLSLPLT
ncbi:HAMP domain-containing sensor histidine kinase [Okeania sp. KiyG1]|uniref:sensor histidine kinase n=1 Tax=Okeania sp. KiyG1 TaxID=2720165 RepID=UPI001922D564|nr:ATP-binding protein [Okeania sp. KiyG1]GGA57291.1 hypothetical protein CYANOKiyG1_78340 [Okeania sp. KiyG1]